MKQRRRETGLLGNLGEEQGKGLDSLHWLRLLLLCAFLRKF